jgi:hypothetical protein
MQVHVRASVAAGSILQSDMRISAEPPIRQGGAAVNTFGPFRALARLAAVALLCTSAPGQPGNPTGHASPDANQIVAQLMRKNLSRSALLQHYEGCRYYLLDYTGFPSDKKAEMVVGVEYNAPAHKEFRVVREGGARLLLNKVLKELLENEKEALGEQNQRSSALTPDNYEFRLVGNETINGRSQYVMDVIPRTKNKYLYRGKVWIDATDYAVSRISAEPARNPSIWISSTQIEHEYTKIGDFWLPAHNVSVSKMRFGGTAKLNINYSNYVIGYPKKASKSDACSNLPREVQLSETH